MLKRKMYEYLLNWKKSKKEECLFIKGARQIGKTYLVRKFGEKEYKSFVEINFIEHPEYKKIFVGDLSANEICKRLTAIVPNINVVPENTLLFLDEIQVCPNARTALKFLAQDNRFDVIASGSLLGLHYGQDADSDVGEIASIPVGYETQVVMYSLDFEEFLWANGYDENAINYLKEFYDRKEKVPAEINDKYEQLFREYIVVGGMPEAVQVFVDTDDFQKVQATQEKILASYDDDISKHAKTVEKAKIRACYDSIPRQLARENKKFKYSEVEKKATARKFVNSIEWLKNADFVNVVTNLYEPYMPLMANSKENEFKIYVNDCGLLMARYGMATKAAILENSLKGNAKGGIYESIISECLIKKGYSVYYYKTQNGSIELEFLIEKDADVIPIEVKAGNTATKSLNNFIEIYKPKYAYKFINGNIGITENRITLPHYMVIFI